MYQGKLKAIAAVLLATVICTGSVVYGGDKEAEFLSKVKETAEQQAVQNISADKVKERTGDLEFLYQTLKEKHPNLFENRKEAEFLAKKKEIADRLLTMSDLDFAIELQVLTAMIGDSHTSAGIWQLPGEQHLLAMSLTSFEGKWILSLAESKNKAYLGQEITAINQHSLEDVFKTLQPAFSYDNETYLQRQLGQQLVRRELLEHFGILKPGENVTLTVKDGAGKESSIQVLTCTQEEAKNIDVASLSEQRKSAPATAMDRKSIYKYMDLGNGNFYIQYNSCQQDPNLPMETFCKQVAEKMETGNYQNVIIDLRNNGGGSDGVLIPLLMQLKEYTWEKGGQLYGLIGEGTFSSALINAVMIKEAGGILVGGPTGGSVDHFGEVGSFELPNSKLKIYFSQKKFDLGTLLEAAQNYGVESMRPDVQVDQTLADYMNGVDTVVNYVMTKGSTIEITPSSKDGLTRGMLTAMLGQWVEQKSGKQIESGGMKFEDVMPFGYYVPYIAWAQKEGIISGISNEEFQPSRLVTREEMAVILERFVASQKIQLAEQSGTAEFADAGSISKWARASVDAVQKLGLIQGKGGGVFDPKGTATRGEAEIIIKKLK